MNQMWSVGEQTKPAKRLHKMVVRVIEGSSSEQLESLAEIIKRLNIVAGHNEIIGAWNGRRGMLRGEDLGVTANLLKQKAEAEKKAEKEKAGRGIDLDELQSEIEELLELLKNRQPGMSDMEWDGYVQKQLLKLHELASHALGK
jgi:hypothetical protein